MKNTENAPYVVLLIIAVMSLGTAMVGLLMGEFRMNSFGSTSLIRRREEPFSFWGIFLALTFLGVAGAVIAVPVLFFGFSVLPPIR